MSLYKELEKGYSMLSDKELKEVRDHYIACALWASNDDRSDHDVPLDRDYTIFDVDPDSLHGLNAMILKFIDSIGIKLNEYLTDHNLEQLGHDLFLTQNGHGSGFWDRKYSDPDLGNFLSDKAHLIGECLPYVNDSGLISFYIPF